MNTNISNNPGKSAGKSVERKVAIITGGSRGLGRNTALHLARKGVDVIITFRSRQSEADTVVAEIVELGGKAVALPLDVGNSKSFAEFVERIGATLRTHWQRDSFDYLVNNAGIGIHASFAETSEAQFDELMNVHFKGTFFLTQALLPLIVDGGRIVNLSSGLARFALPGFAAYAAMKGAIEVLTRYLAKELGPRGIAVNTVAPGAIETDFGGGQVRDNAQLNAQIAAQTALGRVGVPDDIGGVIASLLSDDNRWINGQRLEASGGIFCSLGIGCGSGASRRHAWRQGLAKALMPLLPAGFLQ
ncbi:SDR family oxidoreductase [Propionivibrio sp.]|uniref:SDR family NAD(P)-dependent oxidoreductase n=1 Tax=Propionivibrio sp. TaxID=2212460 RepID=UPI0025EFBD70|nr:SDR family oxidoreductase [Propionivibrio sp.]MBK7355646.1 SDR family oxidoreductase [Propionivibrio sp.]